VCQRKPGQQGPVSRAEVCEAREPVNDDDLHPSLRLRTLRASPHPAVLKRFCPKSPLPTVSPAWTDPEPMRQVEPSLTWLPTLLPK
jgi:hypothetical protein